MSNLWLDGGVLRGYYGEGGDVILPDFIYDVGGYVFRNQEHIRSVTVPDGAIDIGYGCFSGCTGLTRVVLPDSILRIDMYAFSGCKRLPEVKLPAKMKILRDSTFIHCSGLRKVGIPDGVETIEFHAFYGCDSLAEIRALGVTSVEDPIIDRVTKCILPQVPIDGFDSQFMKLNAALGFAAEPALYDWTHSGYVEFVSANADRIAELSVQCGFPEPLRYLKKHDLLNRERLPAFIDTAQKSGRTEITTFLLECQAAGLDGDDGADAFWNAFDKDFEL